MMVWSPHVWDHFVQPRHRGLLDQPTAEGWAGSTRTGQFMRMQIRVEEDVVLAAAFQTFGCVPAIACGSYLSDWATGRPTAEVLALTAAELEELLGGLPQEKRYCADLALTALRRALGTSDAA